MWRKKTRYAQGIGFWRSWIACAPPIRSLSVRRSSFRASGLRPVVVSMAVETIERPGNSSASAGSIQPGSGATSHSSRQLDHQRTVAARCFDAAISVSTLAKNCWSSSFPIEVAWKMPPG